MNKNEKEMYEIYRTSQYTNLLTIDLARLIVELIDRIEGGIYPLEMEDDIKNQAETIIKALRKLKEELGAEETETSYYTGKENYYTL